MSTIQRNIDIFAVWKPKGPTSHDIIDAIRKITGVRRVGHAGTLDPLAEGILVVGVGREATKQLHEVVLKEKQYLAVIRLGEESVTDDAEGERKKFVVAKQPPRKTVKSAVREFVGTIDQVPPAFSAVRINGQRAYKLARRNIPVVPSARRVHVKKIRIVRFRWPYLMLRAVTGPGVYIRALARDIGRVLGVGGYLYSLERTRVGEFTRKNAVKLSQLKNKKEGGPLIGLT